MRSREPFESVSPGSVPLIVMSICIIGYGAYVMDGQPGALQIAAYIFWILMMAVLYYELEVIIRAVSLYVVSMARMEQVEEAGIDLCMKLPGIAFYGIYKVIFYLILPYGLLATLPVQRMIGEMNWQKGLYGGAIVVLSTLITCVVWKRGLTHYNSASS